MQALCQLSYGPVAVRLRFADCRSVARFGRAPQSPSGWGTGRRDELVDWFGGSSESVRKSMTGQIAASTTVVAEGPLGRVWEGMAVPLPIKRACVQARSGASDRRLSQLRAPSVKRRRRCGRRRCG
jgi:hypothetical protein